MSQENTAVQPTRTRNWQPCSSDLWVIDRKILLKTYIYLTHAIYITYTSQYIFFEICCHLSQKIFKILKQYLRKCVCQKKRWLRFEILNIYSGSESLSNIGRYIKVAIKHQKHFNIDWFTISFKQLKKKSLDKLFFLFCYRPLKPYYQLNMGVSSCQDLQGNENALDLFFIQGMETKSMPHKLYHSITLW